MRYDWVARLKEEQAELTIVLNGGIQTALADALGELEQFDGMMLGRAAYHSPWLLAELQAALFEQGGVPGARMPLRG